MGVLIDNNTNKDNNYSNFYDKKFTKMKSIFNSKYEKIYNDYKSRFHSEFCILLVDDVCCYGYLNSNNNDIIIENIEINDINSKSNKNNKNENKKYIYFQSNHLYKKIPSLLEHNVSVILINPDYNVTAVHHPENKYHSNSFSFVYFPF